MIRAARIVAALLAVVFCAAPLAAQEPKAAIVISLASHEKLTASIDQVVAWSGVQLPKPPAELIQEAFTRETGIKEFPGLDKSKPWGMVLLSGSSMKGGIGFLPIADLKALLDALPDTVEKKDEGDGVTRISRKDRRGDAMCIKGANGWVYLADEPQFLKDLPADPAALLGDLPDNYLLGMRLKMANVTAEQREEVWRELKHELPPDMLAKVKAGLEQLDEVTVGAKVDGAAKQIVGDLTIKATAGSQLAATAARLGDRMTRFAGLRSPEAAFFFATSIEGNLTPAELEQLKAQHDEAIKAALAHIDNEDLIKEESKPVFKEAVSTLLAVWFDTAKAGIHDGGLVVLTQPKPALIAGGHVSDGPSVLAALKRLATLIDENGPVGEIKWDAEEYGGYKLSKLKIALPPFFPALGDGIEVMAAVNKQTFLFAVGPDADTALKKLIDAGPGAGKVPAVEARLRLKTILDAVVKNGPPQPMLQPLIQQLAALKPGADEVTVASVPLDGGVTLRLTIGEGAIKAVGGAVGMWMMARELAAPPEIAPGAFEE